MTANLRLVPDATERQPDELAAERPRDRLAEARLADAGRPDEAQDRLAATLEVGRGRHRRGGVTGPGTTPGRLVGGRIGSAGALERPAYRVIESATQPDRGRAVPPQLLDREMLEDPVLDLLEVIVVLVEHGSRPPDVDLAAAQAGPGKIADPLEPGPDQSVLRAGLGDRRKASKFAIRLATDLVGQVRLLDPAAQRIELQSLAGLPELGLDGAQLLPQYRLPLRLGQPFLRPRGDRLPRARGPRSGAEALRRGGEASPRPGRARASPGGRQAPAASRTPPRRRPRGGSRVARRPWRSAPEDRAGGSRRRTRSTTTI